jgi:hypothetical protein
MITGRYNFLFICKIRHQAWEDLYLTVSMKKATKINTETLRNRGKKILERSKCDVNNY